MDNFVPVNVLYVDVMDILIRISIIVYLILLFLCCIFVHGAMNDRDF